MTVEVISDQQLRPEVRYDIVPPPDLAAGSFHRPVSPRQGASRVQLAVLAVTLPLEVSVACVLALALRTYQALRVGEIRSLDLKALPPTVPLQVVANISKHIALDSPPKAAAIKITVQPHQRLPDIALQYLGSADLQC